MRKQGESTCQLERLYVRLFQRQGKRDSIKDKQKVFNPKGESKGFTSIFDSRREWGRFVGDNRNNPKYPRPNVSTETFQRILVAQPP